MTSSERSALGERWAAISDTPLLVVSLAYIGVLLAPYLFRLTSIEARAVDGADWAIWVVFAGDYGFRLWASESRLRFVRNHKLDLAVVLLPFLRPFRALRFLRVLRILSIATSTQARARRSTHVRVSLYAALTSLTAVLAAGLGISSVESASPTANIHGVGDGLWWAATTIATVGYGDRFPVTTAGRLIAIGLMVVGIAMLGVVTASIAAWFVDRLQRVQDAEETTKATLDDVLAQLAELRAELQSQRSDGSVTPEAEGLT